MYRDVNKIREFATELLPNRCLIINPDSEQSDLAEALREAGLNVFEVSEYREGTSILAECLPPVVIVNEAVPELWHPGALATLKGCFDLPVLVIGNGDEVSLVAAIQQGADGYLDRKASSREQLARIRAVLRRMAVTKVSQSSWL